MLTNPDLKTSLASYLVALADDELILGHRDSEWCGHAPILEEDIAFANLALDEIGHAASWYALAAELKGKDSNTYPDQMVYFRPEGQFRCTPLVELSNGDWAFSMLRQYLFDAAEMVRLEALEKSSYEPVAQTAAKIRKEELYHQRHTQAWVRRLGLGTEESHRRLQAALDRLWPYLPGLFMEEESQDLAEAGIVPAGAALYQEWLGRVGPIFKECELTVPAENPLTGTRGEHDPGFHALLAELQSVAHSEPEAQW